MPRGNVARVINLEEARRHREQREQRSQGAASPMVLVWYPVWFWVPVQVWPTA